MEFLRGIFLGSVQSFGKFLAIVNGVSGDKRCLATAHWDEYSNLAPPQPPKFTTSFQNCLNFLFLNDNKF